MQSFRAALGAAVTFLGLLAGSGSSQATVIFTTDAAEFAALGTIAHNSTFEDFGDVFGFPGNPFTRGGVTYTSAENATAGVSSGYPVPTTLITNNFWTPITGDLDPVYNMFGFDIGSQISTVTFTIFTDAGSYVFDNETVGSLPNLTFAGFYSPDELLTGFRIDVDLGANFFTGLTNVRVGSTAFVVPEPATMALFGAGLLGLGLMSRRRKAA